MSELCKKFWLNDPAVLYENLEFIPTQSMTNAERMNALTRLLILVTIGLYYYGYDQYFNVFILGILLILILKGGNEEKENFSARRGNPDPCKSCGENSTLPYINTKYERTPMTQVSHVNYGNRSYNTAKYKVIPEYVPSPYSEVWRNEPRYCNEFISTPKPYTYIEQPTEKCNFEDRSWVENTPSGISNLATRVKARPAIQSAFMRDSMEYRNNIMGEYIDQFDRQRQHNCVDFKPGRKTF